MTKTARTTRPTYEVSYPCGHSKTFEGARLDYRADHACDDCRAIYRARQAKINAEGGYATGRQLGFLGSLTGRRVADLRGISKQEASRRIDEALAAQRRTRRSYYCDCPSGRLGGVCTCCCPPPPTPPH